MRGTRAKQLRGMAQGNTAWNAPYRHYFRGSDGVIRLTPDSRRREVKRLKRAYKNSRGS